ncbi:MAG: hypothetical protein RBR32_03725 [Bacteroidales bacterium]|nr:hypothetical protein [Bacteroidales bacterium]
MNIYKVLTFDGYNSNEYIVMGYDIVQAINNNGYIIPSQVIKTELIGSKNVNNTINY